MITTGGYHPILQPWSSLGLLVVCIYLLTDHRQAWLLRNLRFPVWLFNAALSWYMITCCRGRHPASTLGLGIVSAWSIIWTSVFLVFDDCQANYLRLQQRNKSSISDHEKSKANGEASLSDVDRITIDSSNGSIRKRGDGGKKQQPTSHASTSLSTDKRYYWESYPISSLVERFDWMTDVLTDFRGISWNWRVSYLPPLPREVAESLHSETTLVPRSQKPSRPRMIRTFDDRSALLKHNLFLFIRAYLMLDLIKTVMLYDPYFWAHPSPSGPMYLPLSLRSSPIVVRIVRLLIGLGALRFVLEIIFSLGPLVFVGILGPISGIRSEPFLYPATFGPMNAVFSHGLAGWWGVFWHQTFRRGFEAPAAALLHAFSLSPRSGPGRAVQLIVAFGLSAFLHACGSLTLLGETRPLHGPAAFFMLQAVGVALQLAIGRIGVVSRLPLRVRRWSNFLISLFWLYHTAGLLMDDFASGGIWLAEPIPVSFLRGALGLGEPGDGWWQWNGLISWHQGKHWWQSGIPL